MPHRKKGATKEKVGNENKREQECCGEKMGNTEKQVGLNSETPVMRTYLFIIFFQ
jgi:hypothetical protein